MNGNAVGVQLLLDAGASRTLLNLAGKTPRDVWVQCNGGANVPAGL